MPFVSINLFVEHEMHLLKYKGGKNMYLIGILIFLVFLVVLGLISGGTLLIFVDFPSLVVILTLTIPILLASGLFQDMVNGFKQMGKKENSYSMIELKRILQACKLTIRARLMSGIIGTIVGTISLLSNLTKPEMIGPSLAVAILTVFYSIVFTFVILPIQAKTHTILDTYEGLS